MPDGAQAPHPIFSFLPVILVFFIFYLLVIRPQQKRQKTHEEEVKHLTKGDQVVTSGGIHGLIAGVKDDTFLLKIADNVKVEVSKNAISVIKKKSQEEQST
ncbi:MAG: preprotein translocase subunit YajC [Candidatus Omnitrophica bacterium]|nr:preprotein translocase subunit YajC [Candidatus Omnitrophota bacterium]